MDSSTGAESSEPPSTDKPSRAWNNTTNLDKTKMRRDEHRNFHGELSLYMREVCRCEHCKTQSATLDGEYNCKQMGIASFQDTELSRMRNSNTWHFKGEACDQCENRKDHSTPHSSYTEYQAKCPGGRNKTAPALRQSFLHEFQPDFNKHLETKLSEAGAPASVVSEAATTTCSDQKDPSTDDLQASDDDQMAII